MSNVELTPEEFAVISGRALDAAGGYPGSEDPALFEQASKELAAFHDGRGELSPVSATLVANVLNFLITQSDDLDDDERAAVESAVTKFRIAARPGS
jgi:hypothetical protein